MFDRLLLRWAPPGASYRRLRASLFLVVEAAVVLPGVTLELLLGLLSKWAYVAYRHARYGVLTRRVGRLLLGRPWPP